MSDTIRDAISEHDRAILVEALQVAKTDACCWGEFGGNHDHVADYMRLIGSLGDEDSDIA